MAQSKIRKVIVKVQVAGDQALKKLNASFVKLNKTTKKMGKDLSFFKGALIAAFTGVGIRGLIKTVDTFQLLSDRINVFTGSAKKTEEIFKNIQIIAAATKSSIDVIAEGYNRVAIATDGLGLSSDQTLGVVAALQQTVRLSGASAQEASSVFLQFSQALSLGRLQGQELRAVMLSNVKLAGLLAGAYDEVNGTMNTTKGELKLLGEQGKLTSEVMLKALLGRFQQLNEEAGKLKPTIEQSAIVALDALRVKMFELAKDLKVSQFFAKLSLSIINNVDSIFLAFKALTVTLVSVFIPAILKGLVSLAAAAWANPIIAAIGVVSGAILYLATATEETQLRIQKALLSVGSYFSKLGGLTNTLFLLMGKMGGPVGSAAVTAIFELKRMVDKLGVSNVDEKIAEINEKLKGFVDVGKDATSVTEAYFKTLLKAAKKQIDFSSMTKKTNNAMKELNASFDPRHIERYRFALNSLKKEELSKKLEDGKIDVLAYMKALKGLNQQLLDLEPTSTRAGKGIEAGLNSYLKSAGTLTSNLADTVGNALGGLEDKLVEFATTGKVQFKDLIASIMEDITRMVIRLQITAPLVQALRGSMGMTASANGNIFQGGNVTPFASGGVVGSPTIFPMANGGVGLMGEAGPEAIMPLQRDSQGRLGVSGGGTTIVNVINNSDSTATTTESQGPNGEKQIDVLIASSVSKAIGDGRLDRTMSEVYGLNRRGR